MTNQELAQTFDLIADLLEIKGEVIYKTLAYRRAAEGLRSLSEDAALLDTENRLKDIPGVGEAISEKIHELLATGQLGFLTKLEQEVPRSLVELLQVPGVGPKKALLFWKQLNVTNLEQLEEAVKAGKLDNLPGMGEKSQTRILEGIEALKRRSTRRLLGTARPIALRWLEWLRAQPGVVQADVAGSLRRWRATIGDLDLVAASENPGPIMDALVAHPQVQHVLGQGANKSSVELKDGLNMQLWIQPPSRFGTLLQFVTGSKDHGVLLRELSQRMGLSLSDQAITGKDGVAHEFATEEEVYQFLGVPWMPPELREDRGEIEAALKGKLPHLITLEDIHADLHTHTTWSDGVESVETMARAAIERGIQVLAITDHSAGLGIASGLTVERLHRQREEIQAVQAKLGSRIHLLQGSEVEIHADGSLDFPDEVLAELDIVIVALHTSLRQPRAQVTERLIQAMRHPHVDIVAHPSGRLMPDREGADLDWEAVFAVAKEAKIALEIDAHPARLDLDEVYARRAASLGIPLSIDTDAHAIDNLDLMQYGVAVARRAWVEAPSVLNTWPTQRLLQWLQRDKQ
jgi:DNA polymerase (family 10)